MPKAARFVQSFRYTTGLYTDKQTDGHTTIAHTTLAYHRAVIKTFSMPTTIRHDTRCYSGVIYRTEPKTKKVGKTWANFGF